MFFPRSALPVRASNAHDLVLITMMWKYVYVLSNEASKPFNNQRHPSVTESNYVISTQIDNYTYIRHERKTSVHLSVGIQFIILNRIINGRDLSAPRQKGALVVGWIESTKYDHGRGKLHHRWQVYAVSHSQFKIHNTLNCGVQHRE
jgi:hypothetical protein